MAALLVSAHSSLGAAVDKKHGLVVRINGKDYGVYDEHFGDLVRWSDGKFLGRMYWSGIELGPLGRFGVSTTHPWFREAAPLVLVATGVLGAALGLRRFFERRLRVST